MVKIDPLDFTPPSKVRYTPPLYIILLTLVSGNIWSTQKVTFLWENWGGSNPVFEAVENDPNRRKSVVRNDPAGTPSRPPIPRWVPGIVIVPSPSILYVDVSFR